VGPSFVSIGVEEEEEEAEAAEEAAEAAGGEMRGAVERAKSKTPAKMALCAHLGQANSNF
jgi:hypothetical protein